MATATKLEERLLVPMVREGREFYNNSLTQALRNLQSQGHEPVFMPELADARTNADKDSKLWTNWWTTPSIKATGRTKNGTAVVVYAHVPSYLSEPGNIENAIKQGLVRGAGIMPQSEFQRLLDLEDGKRVFVVDYGKLRDSKSGTLSIEQALEHPQIIPFLGGEARAEAYLQKHSKIYGDRIGIWHGDYLGNNPVWRVLFLGDDYNGDLYGLNDLDDGGRFLGVRAEGAAPQKTGLTRAQLTNILNEYVAPKVSMEIAEKIAKL